MRHCDRQTLDLVASFQAAVVGDLTQRTMAACEEYGGADAAGDRRGGGQQRPAGQPGAPRATRGVRVRFPSRVMSTDNAAMIAAAAYSKWMSKEFADGSFGRG